MFKKNTLQRGFTLIELLVVVAIIGILSSIVLVSLNSARKKGKDASAKGSLSSMRASAEILYDDFASYATVCDDNTPTRVLLDAAIKQTGGAPISTSTTDYCIPGSNSWAASVQMTSVVSSFCVDSDGFAGGGVTGQNYIAQVTTGGINKCVLI